MPLNIVRADEPITVEHTCILVYGQPGVGKTTLGYMCAAPLMLDFDGGAQRAVSRSGDTVRIQHWQEVADMTADDLAPYSTLILDTGGRALDKLTASILHHNPKTRGPQGTLTRQGYGELKSAFINWLTNVREMGKDVVILAHDAEDKQGDDLVMRPDIVGGSKQELIKAADAIGYMYHGQKGVVLDFNATHRWIGKNVGGFDPLDVPNLFEDAEADYEWFGNEVVQGIKDAMNAQTEEQAAALAEVDQWRADIQEITDPEMMAKLIPTINEHSQRKALRQIAWDHAQSMGWNYDRQQGKFVKPAAPEQPDEPPQTEPEGGQQEDDPEAGIENDSAEQQQVADKQPASKKKAAAKKKAASKKKAAAKKKASSRSR